VESIGASSMQVDHEMSELKGKKSSTDGISSLKEPSVDSRLLSTSSDDSYSKYNTPAGSLGDLSNQHDKSPNQTNDKNKSEDSGIDSQSISISHKSNVLVSSSKNKKNEAVCDKKAGGGSFMSGF
jgi:hypothetical protein